MAAREKKTGVQVNIPMCLACVLLCLTLFSVHFSSGVVARYTTTTDSSDSARVIQFGDLTLTETAGQTYIAPGMVLEWNAEVNFEGSESATYVFVEVSGVHSGADGTVTLFDYGPEWSVDMGTDKWAYLGAYGGKYVYYQALGPNEVLSNVVLFKNNGMSTAVSEDLTAADLNGISVSPVFRASVVQSNGFDSPAAAWNSLEANH